MRPGFFLCIRNHPERKPVYFPYILNGQLVYQDDHDHCRLHVCDPDGQNDRRLIDDIVFQHVSDGSSIYYRTYKEACTFDEYNKLVGPEGDESVIRQFDLATGEIETIISTDTGGWGAERGNPLLHELERFRKALRL